jgi:hypothetical protein
MSDALADGEASPKYFSYLEDRGPGACGEPQPPRDRVHVYSRRQGGSVESPIEDPGGLAARGAEVRMEPFEENEARIHADWGGPRNAAGEPS